MAGSSPFMPRKSIDADRSDHALTKGGGLVLPPTRESPTARAGFGAAPQGVVVLKYPVGGLPRHRRDNLEQIVE
jgi:hypothetical protein